MTQNGPKRDLKSKGSPPGAKIVSQLLVELESSSWAHFAQYRRGVSKFIIRIMYYKSRGPKRELVVQRVTLGGGPKWNLGF